MDKLVKLAGGEMGLKARRLAQVRSLRDAYRLIISARRTDGMTMRNGRWIPVALRK